MTTLLQARDRIRGWYLLAVLATIAAGLSSRRFPGLLPSTLGKYPGDTLWALMVFLGWGYLLRKMPSLWIAALTLATCSAVEVLKLWPSPWWADIRNTTAGLLVFGYAFSWQNLIAYAAGAALGLVMESVVPPNVSRISPAKTE